MYQIWFIIVIILLIEAFRHPSSAIASFSIASIPTLIISLFLNNLLLEIILFIFFTISIRLYFSNKLSKLDCLFHFSYNNTDCLIQQTGTVIKSIGIHPFDTGLVHINNENWIAWSSTPIKEGNLVQVQAVQGVRLNVIPCTSSSSPSSH